MTRGRALLAAALLGGCGLEEWRNADLQLDVTDASLGDHPDETRVRICVEGAGNAEEALGAGRLGFPGLPAGEPLQVTVDTLSDEDEEIRTGRAGPVTLGEGQPYAELAWEACEEGCAACRAEGQLAAADEADWLLAVRFLD